MRIAVMGAGAVGCYYGGLLARAGHEVCLIGRAQHTEALKRRGLLLDAQGVVESVAVKAATQAEGVHGAEWVLCCVKSTDTAAAAAAMAPHLAADATVISLQNGIDNPDLLRARLPQQVLPAAVYVATQMVGDGHVRHRGGGRLILGDTPKARQAAAMFTEAGVAVESSDNIMGALWTKLIINCAYNALSAITALPYAALSRQDGVMQTLRAVVDECLSVAKREGETPAGDVWAGVERIPHLMPEQISSTAQDLQRGRQTEIDYLNGSIVRRADALGIDVPTNRLLYTLVKLLESRLT